jgi:hypothetical protein
VGSARRAARPMSAHQGTGGGLPFLLGSDIVGAYSQVVRPGSEGVMSRFILLEGILIAAWFVFMATFPFPEGAWAAFFYSCETLVQTLPFYGYEAVGRNCPATTLEAMRFAVIGVSALLIGFASWSFWKGTRQ